MPIQKWMRHLMKYGRLVVEMLGQIMQTCISCYFTAVKATLLISIYQRKFFQLPIFVLLCAERECYVWERPDLFGTLKFCYTIKEILEIAITWNLEIVLTLKRLLQ